MTHFDTLVLSGGMVKGYAFLGAIQGLIDLSIYNGINTFVGTSVGAILGYLLAIGYTPIEILTSIYKHGWLEKLKYFDLVSMINGNGAATYAPLNEALEKFTIDKIGKYITLGKLKEEYGKTLLCTTYNMTTCKTEYIGPDNHPDMPCLVALRMSANIPLVFDRFKYMDSYYVDGGISDNFPIIKGDEIGNSVIGIYHESHPESLQDRPEDGMMAYFLRLLQVPVVQTTLHKISLVSAKSFIVRIKTEKTESGISFDVKSKDRLDMFSSGYNQLKDAILERNRIANSKKDDTEQMTIFPL